MSYYYVPTGTAKGPDWQYRIERDGDFTPWVAWSDDLVFSQDPDGAGFRTEVIYWLYARNVLIPDDAPGSLVRPLVASLIIQASGAVTSGSPGGGGSPEPISASLLGLTIKAGVNTTEHPSEIPATMALLLEGMSDANVVALYRRLLVLGYGGGSGSGSETLYEVLDDPHCFDEPVLAILENAIANYHLQVKSVSAENVDFLKVGQNLYNKDSRYNKEGYYITDAGYVIANEGYSISHRIPVKPLTTYTASSDPGDPQFLAYFDIGGNHLGGASSVRGTGSFTTPIRTAYILATVPNNVRNNFQIVEGETALAFKSYSLLLMGETVGEAAIRITAKTAKLQIDSFLADRKDGKNLFNKNSTPFLAGTVVYNNGTTGPNADYNVYKIPLKPATTYTQSDKQFAAFFDIEGNLTGGISYDRTNYYFTTPANTAYGLFTVGISGQAVFQMELGNTNTFYVDYKPTLDVITPQATQAQVTATQAQVTADLATPLLDLFSRTSNLFNAFDPDNLVNQFIYFSGAIGPNVGTNVTHFIKVDPSTVYNASNDPQFIAFFDKNKVALGAGVSYDRPNGNFTTTLATAYIRATYGTADKQYRITKGSANVPFQPFGAYTTSAFLQSTAATSKVILQLGTSIPAGTLYGSSDSSSAYPNQAARALGAIMFNNAVGSSTVRIFDHNGTYAAMYWQNAVYSLGHTVTEKNYILTNWSTIRTQFINASDAPTSFTTDQANFIRSCSYEQRVLPYINGTLATADAVVLSHGHNDPMAGETDSQFYTVPSDPYNRNFFLGAANYIIREILKINPRILIVIEGDYENQLKPFVATAQQTLANYWQRPIWKFWEEAGSSQRVIPGTAHLYGELPYSLYASGVDTSQDMTEHQIKNPDRVHPSSDSSGKTLADLARIYRNHLARLF